MSADLRPAWVEVNLDHLERNFRIIRNSLPPRVQLMYVLKDEAYGLGAVRAAQIALAQGVSHLAAYTLGEAASLRAAGINAPILLLGERVPEELPACLDLQLIPAVGSLAIAHELNRVSAARGIRTRIHLKINTGMNRFGFPWRDAHAWAAEIPRLTSLAVEGAFSHFAQSDELDKTFARLQLDRFHQTLATLAQNGIHPTLRHHANSGAVLDLPEAHLDLVRVGILPLGIYPSAVCRRLDGIAPVLSVKARITSLQLLEPGDTVGYGMRWTAQHPSHIGVVPVGYGDGFPRVRNEGHALVAGRRVPLVGGVTMDALMLDLTDVPEARVGEDVVLLGRQGDEEITAQDMAALRRSVTYDVLVAWRSRLPRRYVPAPSLNSP
jgi:alanine racemase